MTQDTKANIVERVVVLSDILLNGMITSLTLCDTPEDELAESGRAHELPETATPAEHARRCLELVSAAATEAMRVTLDGEKYFRTRFSVLEAGGDVFAYVLGALTAKLNANAADATTDAYLAIAKHIVRN